MSGSSGDSGEGEEARRVVRMVNGTPRPFGDDKPPGGKTAGMVVGAFALVGVVGLGASGGLDLGILSGGPGADTALPGNVAGDVVDSLPGRDWQTRKSEGRKSAQKGNRSQTWSKLNLKELKRKFGEEIKQLKCAAEATGKVRDYLTGHPCTSMRKVIFALGDGHGNAAVVSVVWVGFRTRAQAEGFEEVERVQGAGDVRPLGAAVLGLAGITFTGHHYGAHRDRTIMAIAEAETAAGHVEDADLDAIADVSAYFPHS